MKKHWKWIVLLLALCIACGVWFYYETELQLSQLLPKENWSGVTLSDYQSTVTKEAVTLDAVLEAIDSTTLDRGQAFHSMPAPFYMIQLDAPDGPPTLIYVLEDGRVSVAVELGDYQHFENGGELYKALQELAASE